jgi:hypothetical protein
MPGKVFFATTCALMLAGAVNAGPVGHRQARQADRIRHGVATGALTPRETARLATEQRAIAAEAWWYRRNGLQPWERRDLQRDQNRASRHIWLEAHDRQGRW